MSLRRYPGSVTVLADAVHFPMLSSTGPLFCRVTHEALSHLESVELPLTEEDAITLFELYRDLIEQAASRQFARGIYYVILRPCDLPRTDRLKKSREISELADSLAFRRFERCATNPNADRQNRNKFT